MTELRTWALQIISKDTIISDGLKLTCPFLQV